MSRSKSLSSFKREDGRRSSLKGSLSILIFNWKDVTNPAAGGGTYYTHRVAKYLVEKGYKVTLLCANYKDGRKRERIDGVDIIRVGSKYTVYIKAFSEFLRNLRNKFNLVIDEINALPWLTPLYVKAPKIAFIHQTTKEALFKELNVAIATLLYFIEKITLLFYRKLPFITVSPSVKEELIKNGVPQNNIFVIYPGIDVKRYKEISEEKASFPLVLYLGRLKKYKGVQNLIQAMKYVIKEKPEAKLLIVGRGDYRSKLEKMVKKLGLQKTVGFRGYVSEEEKIHLLKKAWLLVIPSIKEGFGIVAIEAAICGTPTIGTNTLGLRDSIIHGRTGFLVPYGKPRILAQKICEILDNKKLRIYLSENAREWGRKFDWEKSLQKIETIIKQKATAG